MADILAGRAASLSALLDLTMLQLASNASRAFHICMRLATCEWIHKCANETLLHRQWVLSEVASTPLKEKVQQIEDRLRWCGHNLTRLSRNRMRCSTCGITKPNNLFGFWLLQPCDNHSSDAQPAVPVAQVRGSQVASLPKGLCWNGHRIVRSGQGFVCMLCKESRADLSYGVCSIEAENSLPETIIQGSLADFLKACRERRQPRATARSETRRVDSVALSLCSQAVPAPIVTQATCPRWMITTANKHLGGELHVGGGYLVCSRCGFMCSTSSDTRLATPCRGFMPQGSTSKVKRLLSGKNPYAKHQEWPDGRAASEIVSFRRLTLEQTLAELNVVDEEVVHNDMLLAPDESSQEEWVEDRLPTFYVKPTYQPSSDEKQAISAALDSSLALWQSGEPSFAELFQLGLPADALEQCALD